MTPTPISEMGRDDTPGGAEVIIRRFNMSRHEKMTYDGRFIYLNSNDPIDIAYAQGYLDGFCGCTKACRCILR